MKTTLATLLLALMPAYLGAQTTPIRPGETGRGELSSSDRSMNDNSYFERWSFVAEGGKKYAVTLRSGAFDAYLVVGPVDAAGACSDECISDDDSGGDTDSQVEFVPERTGTVYVRVNSLGAKEVGAFTLTVTEVTAAAPVAGKAPKGGASAPPASAALTSIALDQTVRGELTTSDLKLDDDTYYDPYVIQGAVGDRYVITMRSSAFDAWLSVGIGTLEDFQSIDFDDDSGGGTDSQIEVQLKEPRLIIRANAVSSTAAGSYSLRVTQAAGGAPAPRPSNPNPATPAPSSSTGLREIRVGCVVQNQRMRGEVVAQYNPATGDTLVDGRPFREVWNPAEYAGSAPWFINAEPITLNGARYTKYGLPRVLSIAELQVATPFRGLFVWVEAGTAGLGEVVYMPVRPGCDFQPYQRAP